MSKYKVELTLTEDMLGTVPKNKELYSTYIESKRPSEVDGPPEVDTVIDGELGCNGFHTDENGDVILYNLLIKGFIKNAGNTIKDFPEVKIKNLRSKLNNWLFVSPRKIFLAKKIDGTLERPLRAQTAQGPRTSLKKSDFVKAGTKIEFCVEVLNDNVITEKLLRKLFDYGQYLGLGEWRNGGYGTFTYKMEKMK